MKLGASSPGELLSGTPEGEGWELMEVTTASAHSQTTDHSSGTGQGWDDVLTLDSQVRSHLFSPPPPYAHWSTQCSQEDGA